MDNIADWANNKILDLWEKYEAQSECRIKEAPLVFHELTQNTLLFIGINPSSSERGHQIIEKRSNRANGEVKDLLPWKGRAQANLPGLTAFEKSAWEHYDYFSKFREASRLLNIPWSHIDLFFYRMRSQKDFKKLIFEKGQLTDFARNQLNLAFEIMDAVEPKAIVVANALACKIMSEQKPFLKKELDADLGCLFYQTSKGRRVPTFFTSMLTGQRALDRGSFERLIWQIGRALRIG